jgi:hypothetical protein
MRPATLLVVTAGLLVPIAAAATDPEPIPALVGQLGSLKYSEREAACRSLDALGAAALPALREARTADDLEVRRRAEVLVQRIERRLEAERLLEPTRVRFAFQALPVPEAVAAIKRQTGYTIHLGGDLSTLAKRTVTLDTGECTFWEALDRFCSRAALKENPKPVGSFQEERFSIVQNGGVVTQLMARYPYSGSLDRNLTLYDGPPAVLPTHQCGAIRFRAVRPQNDSAGLLPVSMPGFILDVTPEPRLAWQGIIDTRIDRAVDDEGQLRTHVAVTTPPSLEAEVRWLIDTEFGRPAHPSQVAIRLLPAEKPANRLREVKGRVTAQVLTPPETVLEIGDILQAAGQTYAGSEDTRVKVLEASNPPKMPIKIRLQIEGPATNPMLWNAAGIVRANRRWNGTYSAQSPSSIWSLLDAEGRSYRRLGYEVVQGSVGGNGVVQEIRLTFQPDAGLGPPARLVETGRRTVLLDVPFVLTDVPL